MGPNQDLTKKSVLFMEHFSCDLSNVEFFLVCLFLCFNLSCFFLKKTFAYFLAMPGLHCCAGFSLIPSSEGCSLAVVRGLP